MGDRGRDATRSIGEVTTELDDFTGDEELATYVALLVFGPTDTREELVFGTSLGRRRRERPTHLGRCRCRGTTEHLRGTVCLLGGPPAPALGRPSFRP